MTDPVTLARWRVVLGKTASEDGLGAALAAGSELARAAERTT